MKKIYLLKILLFPALFLSSCGPDDSEYKEVSPVVMDITAVPYPKLSDYKFFVGEMKNLEPAYKVLPYDLNSELFTDYALKKRFVWMPEGKQATYTSDGEILDFPTGAVLIKNFYYEKVQPNNTTRIIETRLMIRKPEGWIFANYIWNEEQTEAFYGTQGATLPISWQQGNSIKDITYRIPSTDQCANCHNINDTHIPLGPKPQNLNKSFNYPEGEQNQFMRWKQEGYLTTLPENIATMPDWEDESQPLELRARAYLDINCAHCHTQGGGCDHTPMDLAYSQSANPVNLGICVEPVDFVSGNEEYIIKKQDPFGSLLYFRMQTTIPAEMMPPVGRSITHREGLMLLRDYINSLDGTCP